MTDVVRRRLIGAGLAMSPLSAWAARFGYPRLLQGPMVGDVGPTHLTVWGRASGAYSLAVEYSETRDFRSPRISTAVMTSEVEDLCAVVRVDGLKPGARYWYRVLVDGIVDRYQSVPYETRTAPAGLADFRVAFGSCARVVRDTEQRIFDVVARESPDLFLWLGDNVYADAESAAAIADEYRRQRNVPRARAVARSVPQLAIWDDHDFGYNNSDGSSPIKQQSLAVFRRYWANPSYGLPETNGVFFEYHYGGVDFYFLDGRYHRSPNANPDGPAKTMLGTAQLEWLQQRLLASRAHFKVLVSGSGWSMADGLQGDTWAAFRSERDGLFEFIRERKIGGVVLLSGDSHVGELNCIPWSERGGYDLYDLVSSPLAQSPGESWYEQVPEVRMRKVYAGGANVGMLSFSAGPDPALHFDLYDERGLRPWQTLTLHPDELRNGVSSWRSKIESAELERRTRPAPSNAAG